MAEKVEEDESGGNRYIILIRRTQEIMLMIFTKRGKNETKDIRGKTELQRKELFFFFFCVTSHTT